MATMTVTIVGARIAIPTTREIMPRERSPHVCRLCLPVKACADIWHMSRLSFRGRARCVGASCRFLPCSPALAVEATTDSPAAGPCRAGPKWRGHAGRRCRPREAGCRGSHRAEENAGGRVGRVGEPFDRAAVVGRRERSVRLADVPPRRGCCGSRRHSPCSSVAVDRGCRWLIRQARATPPARETGSGSGRGGAAARPSAAAGCRSRAGAEVARQPVAVARGEVRELVERGRLLADAAHAITHQRRTEATAAPQPVSREGAGAGWVRTRPAS